MPRKRAVLLVAWFGRHASPIMTGLAFVVVGLGIWSIYLYGELRSTRSSLTGIEIARIVEARANDRNEVTQCRASIPFIKSFQTLTDTVRDNLRQQAALNTRLAMSEPTPAARRTRLKAADQARKRADALIDLPERNKAFCDTLEANLRIELVRQYGDKLTQLEEEERASRGDT